MKTVDSTWIVRTGNIAMDRCPIVKRLLAPNSAAQPSPMLPPNATGNVPRAGIENAIQMQAKDVGMDLFALLI